jgi:hypothetical protein
MVRDGAPAVDARSRQLTYAADSCTKQMDHRSSFGSAIPRRWRGASALLSTLRRNTGMNRRGGGGGNGDNKDDNDDAQQHINVKNQIICLFICNSCCATEAM